MKISTTIFLTVLLAGIGFYYFTVEKPSASANPKPIKILALADGDSVTWLQVRNHSIKQTMALRRENSSWALEFPVSYPAENLLVNGMVSTLTVSERLRRFSLKGKEKKEFGLESPELEIGVETEKNPKRRYLLMGDPSPVGGGVYAHWEGEDEYFLVPTEVKASFQRKVSTLRRKKLFRLNWDNVTWIRAKIGKKEYRLVKTTGKWVGYLPPRQSEIPLEKVNDLIYAFESLYIKEFLDGKDPEKPEFQLKDKDMILSAGWQAGMGERLILGARAKAANAFYALREKENLPLLVPASETSVLLAKFKVLFRELENNGQGKPKTDSGENSKGVSKSQEKSG